MLTKSIYFVWSNKKKQLLDSIYAEYNPAVFRCSWLLRNTLHENPAITRVMFKNHVELQKEILNLNEAGAIYLHCTKDLKLKERTIISYNRKEVE